MRGAALWLDRALQAFTLALLVALAGVVLLGIAFRYSGNSLIWYDELAAMLLAWITFSGAALAMSRDAHMGFAGLLYGLPEPARSWVFWLVEAIVIGTLAVTAWAGWAILSIFGSESLTSLPFLERRFVQSVLPAGAALMILARLLNLPARLADVRAGHDPESREIAHEIERAEAELAGAASSADAGEATGERSAGGPGAR